MNNESVDSYEFLIGLATINREWAALEYFFRRLGEYFEQEEKSNA